MKALTLWQPWASLVAMGEKTIETRCWSTKYRGQLAIHSAELKPKWLGVSAETDEFRNELADVFNCRRDFVDAEVRALPRGVVLCIVKLVGIEETAGALRGVLPERERIFGNYEDGRYAWNMEMVERFADPIPAKGNRMLWNWEHAVIAAKEKA